MLCDKSVINYICSQHHLKSLCLIFWECVNRAAITSADITLSSRSGGQLSQKKSSSCTENLSGCAKTPLFRLAFFLIKGNISPLFTSVAVTEWAKVAATMLVSPVPEASSSTFLPSNSFGLASRKSESRRAPRHTCKVVNILSDSVYQIVCKPGARQGQHCCLCNEILWSKRKGHCASLESLQMLSRHLG